MFKNRKKKTISILAVSVLAMGLFTGCGAAGANAGDAKEEESAGTIVVKDVKQEVEIPAEPKRIVDLSGNSDMLEILGYDVVGTANSDASPLEIPVGIPLALIGVPYFIFLMWKEGRKNGQ